MSTGKTGPRTPEGKKRVSLNALKHGLTASSNHALRAIERQHGLNFDDVLARMNGHYKPRDPVEEELVTRIARCVWRLSLSATMESRLLSRRRNASKPGVSYERILKYERLVDIHLHRALDAFNKHRGQANPNPQNKITPSSRQA